MSNFVYNNAKRAFLSGEIDFTGDDYRVLLVMTNTTADSEDDKNFISEFTDLDEYDGASYARQSITGEVVNEDSGNNRAEFDGADSVFSTLGAGTRSAQAAILYKHVNDDDDSVPIAYIDTGGFPFAGSGGDITLQWNVEGILQGA